MFYFGCKHRAGHFFWAPAGASALAKGVARLGRLVDLFTTLGIYPQIDGGFCPGAGPAKRRVPYQVEGHAALHLVGGWTVLAFWDRSVDSRYGSNSAFVVKGPLSFSEMVSQARQAFPEVWRRFAFEVVEVDYAELEGGVSADRVAARAGL